MRKFEKVEYTNQIELLLLLVSTVALFSGTIFVLNRIISFGLIKGVLAFFVAGIYFIIIKKKWIVKKSDFILTSNRLDWNNESLDFNNLVYYKIHWIKGAGIKFKLKNGNSIRISSNDHFCNSEKFVNLCREIDSKLLKYNNGLVVRKKSYFETKQGYYFAILLTILFFIGTIYKLFTDEKFSFGDIVLILASLGIVWSGVRWKRK